MVPLSFAQQEFFLLASGALYWPAQEAVLVADLHLEKGSFFAQTGQFIPPYDSRETLDRLASAVRATGARRVITLGDNFHDDAGCDRLEPHARGMLAALTGALDWVWITGNHDPSMEKSCGGRVVEELRVAGIALRHKAMRGESGFEMSGHWHPRVQVKVQRRSIRRPCAVMSRLDETAGRLVLPAFGAYTGGMDAADPAILSALQPATVIEALVPTRERLARFALWRGSDAAAA